MDRDNTRPSGSATYVPPGAGQRLRIVDELLTVIVTGAETGGQYALTDSTVPPGGSAPPHVHRCEDEAFWVLSGELELRVGEQVLRAGPGAFVHLPRGVAHSYVNVGAADARFLTLMVPAGLEQFFVEVGTPATDASSPPSAGAAELERLLAVAPRYGVEILPPAAS